MSVSKEKEDIDDEVVFISETKKRNATEDANQSNSKKMKQSKLNIDKKIISNPLAIQKLSEMEEYDLGKGSILKYWKRYLTKEREEKLFNELESSLSWKQGTWTLRDGRTVLSKRLYAVMSDIVYSNPDTNGYYGSYHQDVKSNEINTNSNSTNPTTSTTTSTTTLDLQLNLNSNSEQKSAFENIKPLNFEKKPPPNTTTTSNNNNNTEHSQNNSNNSSEQQNENEKQKEEESGYSDAEDEERKGKIPWLPSIDELRHELNAILGVKFNLVLIQIYRDGTDYISWHSDKEAIPNGLNTIGSLSLGANRRFLMRPVEGDGEKLEFPLGGGALLVMTGTTQRYWKHTVPKESSVVGPRINLTFRIG